MKKLIIFFLFIFIIVGCANKEYIVMFNTNGGSLIENQTIKDGKLITKPISPTKEGYTFLHWELNSKKFDFKTKIKKNLELVAIWEQNENMAKCEITFENGENKNTVKVNIGEVINEPDSPYKSGYQFIGWHLEGDEEPYDFDQKVTCDLKLIAKYKEDSSTSLTSNDTIYITDLKANVEKNTLVKNETIQINVIIAPENATNKNLVYETSNRRIATVSNTGLVKAIKSGEVTITIKSTDDSGFSDSIIFNIINE